MVKTILLLTCCGLLFAGCATVNPVQRAKENVENAKRLRVGMTKAQVLEIMGEPVKNESFNRPDVWFYYFDMNWFDGLITEDECFPLLFTDGKLAGWGNSFYTKYRIDRRDEVKNVELPAEAAKGAGK